MIRVPVMLTFSSFTHGAVATGHDVDSGRTAMAYFGRLAICARNGLAVANHSAIPTPMMNEASIRPTSRNILVCSSPISSGWRAADSRYLLPMMPMPIHAPMAPRPMIRPVASATKLMTSMIAPRGTLVGWINEKWKTRKRQRNGGPSVGVVRLAQIHERQHHEHERLQRDDQDVEDGPGRAGDDVTDGQADAGRGQRPGAPHQCDQQEDQFAGVHVAEQPHAVRYGLGDELDHLHR